MIYIGSTNNLKKRVEDHNKGKEFFTKKYKPWSLIYYEAYIEEKFARIREMRLKHHGNGLRQLKKRIGLERSKLFKNGAGFTLIELLVVMAVIGVLSAALITQLNPFAFIQRGNDSRRKHDLEQVQRALEMYANDNKGLYPASVAFGSQWASGTTVYMKKVPQDPSSPDQAYFYFSPTGRGSYYIYASLENLKDDQSCTPNNGTIPCSSLAINGQSNTACGGKTCNYGATSSNASP